MSKESDCKTLATTDNYEILQLSMHELTDLISANLGSGKLTASDMETVKAPTRGATHWSIPSASGTKESEALEGIILYHRDMRSYFEGEYDPQTPTMPVCWSVGGEVGYGVPGGYCSSCALARFREDGGKSRPPLCKFRKELYIVTPERMLPMRVSITATSAGEIRKYFATLLAERKFFYTVVTRLEAVRDKSNNGMPCTRIKPTQVATVPAEQIPAVRAFAELLSNLMTTRQEEVETESVTIPDEE